MVYYWSINSDLYLELRHIELDDLYQLFILDSIVAVTKNSNLSTKTKVSTKKSPKLKQPIKFCID